MWGNLFELEFIYDCYASKPLSGIGKEKNAGRRHPGSKLKIASQRLSSVTEGYSGKT